MGGVGDEYLAPVGLAIILQVGLDHEDAAELPLGAGGGGQPHGVHAGDRGQGLLEFVEDGQRTLHSGFGLERVSQGEAGETADILVDLGVVLHGAGAERVEAAVHAVVEAAQTQEVAHDLVLGQLRQVQVRAQEAGIRQLGRRHVRFRHQDALAPRPAEVEGEAGADVRRFGVGHGPLSRGHVLVL